MAEGKHPSQHAIKSPVAVDNEVLLYDVTSHSPRKGPELPISGVSSLSNSRAGLTIRPIVGRKDHKESLLSGYLNAAIVVGVTPRR